MTTLTSRSSAGAADLESVLDLLIFCRVAANVDPWPPIRDLRRHFDATAPEARADTQIWEDAAGTVQAFASIWDGEILLYCIHPRARSDDLLAQILIWAQHRAQQRARLWGELATLCIPIRQDNAHERALLEQRDFRLEAWSTLRMERRLDQPISEPVAPEGFCIRQMAGARELNAVVALHEQIFNTTSAREDRLTWMGDRDYHAELDLVAEGSDGELAGFCVCALSGEEELRCGRREGWVELLGTQRAQRRRGLGRALLLAGLRGLQSYGMDTALLSTTSWNAAAQRLYQSCDFRTRYQVRWYIWDAEPLWAEPWRVAELALVH